MVDPVELVHSDLISVSVAIGSVHEMASWASGEIATAILVSGNSVRELTVRELVSIIDRTRRETR